MSPSALGTLALWLSADVGASASSWIDRSGNGRTFTQGTPANQLTLVAGARNGLPAMRGNADGKRFMQASPWTWSTSGTLILCFAPSTLASTYLVSNSSTGQGALIEGFTGSELEWYNPADRYELAVSVSAGVHVAAVSQVNGGALVGYFDGAQAFAQTASAPFKAPNVLGFSSGSNGTNGDILEVLAFTSALRAADIRVATNLLLGKWS